MKKILSTKDYSLFSFIENNRIVKRSHVNEFIEEIKKDDMTMCFPIVVDSDLRIIDGQHRFHACMELGLPIYYVIKNDSDAEQSMINCNKINKKWEMMDWLRYRANKNGGCYKQLLDFVQQTCTTISNAMVIFPAKAINAATLKAGTTDFGVNEKAFDIVHFLQSQEVKTLSFRNTRAFNLAIRIAFDDYSKRQMDKLKRKILLVPECANYKQYLTVFSNIIKK